MTNSYHILRLTALYTVLTVLGGCVMDNAVEFSEEEEHYQPIIERQKAGIDPEEQSVDHLPEMTVEEFEQLGDAHFQQGNFSSAFSQFSKALEKDPNRVETRYKVGLLLLKVGKPKEAHEQFEKIVEYDVMFAQAYEGMGQALLQMGNDQEAEQEFRRALTFDPKLWKSQNYLGIMADRRHLHFSAIEAYKTALEIQPKEPSVLNNLGMAYYMNGQYPQAVHSFHLGLQAGSDSPKIANNLGLALSKMRRFSEAFDAFRRGTKESMAYNNIGIAHLEAGTPGRAITCFQKAIETQPTFYEKANENLRLAQNIVQQEKKNKRFSNIRSQECF